MSTPRQSRCAERRRVAGIACLVLLLAVWPSSAADDPPALAGITVEFGEDSLLASLGIGELSRVGTRGAKGRTYRGTGEAEYRDGSRLSVEITRRRSRTWGRSRVRIWGKDGLLRLRGKLKTDDRADATGGVEALVFVRLRIRAEDRRRETARLATLASNGEPPPLPSGSPGLLFPDGVEPPGLSGEEVPAGRRIWYVDASAPDGGDGSQERPYNSFEEVVGHEEGGSYRPGLITGGDHLYLRGTFRGSKHVAVSHVMRVYLGRGSQGGTKDEPTVIKTWPGYPRAVLDGEHVLREIIRVRGLSFEPVHGIRIQNVEVARADGRGIHIDEYVTHAEVVSVLVRDTKADPILGTGGGLLFRMTEGAHEFLLRDSLVRDNVKAWDGQGGGNVGGVSILGEPTAEPSSRITIRGLEIRGEHIAVRHKHSGSFKMVVTGNHIHDSDRGIYLRSHDNEIHHNVLWNLESPFEVESENQTGDSLAWIHHNTVVDCDLLLRVFNPEQNPYARRVRLFDNVFQSASAGDGVLVLARWGNERYEPSQWTSGYNLLGFAAPAPSFLFHQAVAYDFDAAMEFLGDSTSLSGSVSFKDPSNRDYRLLPGSPAATAASDGGPVGALPVAE